MFETARFASQALLYTVFAAFTGYFSHLPQYQHHDPDMALIKISFSHAGEHIRECKRLTPEEIAALPPNMRRPLDCPRERIPLSLEVLLGDDMLFQGRLPPSGLSGDGESTIYRRFKVTPGLHKITARLRDTRREEGFDYEYSKHVQLSPQQNFVIDFKSDTGGFRFQ